ncbi:MAG: trypsin-like serine peptidase [Planktomarina sp.]
MIRILILLVCLPLMVNAQSQLERLNSLNDVRAWSAVGRINVEGGGFCTGTLVTERHVLTAGHCLFDAKTGLPVPVRKIEFRAGWTNGRAEAYRKIRSAVTHPAYSFSGNAGMDRVSSDVAILELQMPIRHPWIKPMSIAQLPAMGSDVAVVSYAHDRAESPSLQEICHMVAEESDALILNCNVDFGSSGAPIFRYDVGGPQIVSVVSAKAHMGTTPVALGAKAMRKLSEVPGFRLPAATVGTSTLPSIGLTFLKQ